MWLDPLVERQHLKNINVTTNVLNIRMELLKEKFAADNKQVFVIFSQCVLVMEEQCNPVIRQPTGHNNVVTLTVSLD